MNRGRVKCLVSRVAALGLLFLTAGCSERSSAPIADEPQQTSPATGSPSEAAGTTQINPTAAVSLEPVDEKGLAKAVEERRGKVVLVDYWATWCAPCVALFPHTVELHRKFSESGLSVISLSLDDRESEAEVLEMLTEQGANFTNFISRDDLGPQTIDAFAITDGALPHMKLYDRNGKLHREFVAGRFSTEQIDEAVERLLKTGE